MIIKDNYTEKSVQRSYLSQIYMVLSITSSCADVAHNYRLRCFCPVLQKLDELTETCEKLSSFFPAMSKSMKNQERRLQENENVEGKKTPQFSCYIKANHALQPQRCHFSSMPQKIHI